MKNINWNVDITSHADRKNLSNEQLSKIFNCFNSEGYQEFKNEMIESNKKYDIYPTAKWQLDKADSIEKIWHSKITYSTTNNNVVNVNINIDIDFPKNFDKDDVIIWTEGIDRLNKVYLMVQMEDIVKSNSIDRDENRFLEELVNNQKFKVINY